jgi:peptide deformylase
MLTGPRLLKIARLGHPAIRQVAASVSPEELTSPAVQGLIDDMVETMRDADGVGIAAPQVHVSLRIIAIEVSAASPRYPLQAAVPLTLIVNPQIVSHSEAIEEGWEGCLSVPDLRGRVPRWTEVEVAGTDRRGAPLRIRASGFFARVIQHEVDHLDGRVYLDRLPDLATLTHLREFARYWLENPA